MTDKLVTHADLGVLRDIDAAIRGHDVDASAVAALLDRLIAAAEADQPPLPEGWVVMNAGVDGHVSQGVFCHRDGLLYQWSDDETAWGAVDANKDRLTPLRPTVTEADVEKASQVLRKRGMDYHSGEVAREVLSAAGIEVQS